MHGIIGVVNSVTVALTNDIFDVYPKRGKEPVPKALNRRVVHTTDVLNCRVPGVTFNIWGVGISEVKW